MDFNFWVWLIIAVAGLLIRTLNNSAKKRNTPEQPRSRPDYDQDTGSKPMTFEELLREIQEAKAPTQTAAKSEPIRQSAPIQQTPKTRSYEVVDYDDDIEQEEKDYETIPSRNDNRSNEIYEKAKSEAFSRPSLEETMKLSDTVIKFDYFKGYEDSSQKSVAKEILQDFKDPEGFKKAFIMSEILKRKF
jgi:hypothetical protein